MKTNINIKHKSHRLRLLNSNIMIIFIYLTGIFMPYSHHGGKHHGGRKFGHAGGTLYYLFH